MTYNDGGPTYVLAYERRYVIGIALRVVGVEVGSARLPVTAQVDIQYLQPVPPMTQMFHHSPIAKPAVGQSVQQNNRWRRSFAITIKGKRLASRERGEHGAKG